MPIPPYVTENPAFLNNSLHHGSINNALRALSDGDYAIIETPKEPELLLIICRNGKLTGLPFKATNKKIEIPLSDTSIYTSEPKNNSLDPLANLIVRLRSYAELQSDAQILSGGIYLSQPISLYLKGLLPLADHLLTQEYKAALGKRLLRFFNAQTRLTDDQMTDLGDYFLARIQHDQDKQLQDATKAALAQNTYSIFLPREKAQAVAKQLETELGPIKRNSDLPMETKVTLEKNVLVNVTEGFPNLELASLNLDDPGNAEIFSRLEQEISNFQLEKLTIEDTALPLEKAISNVQSALKLANVFLKTLPKDKQEKLKEKLGNAEFELILNSIEINTDFAQLLTTQTDTRYAVFSQRLKNDLSPENFYNLYLVVAKDLFMIVEAVQKHCIQATYAEINTLQDTSNDPLFLPPKQQRCKEEIAKIEKAIESGCFSRDMMKFIIPYLDNYLLLMGNYYYKQANAIQDTGDKKPLYQKAHDYYAKIAFPEKKNIVEKLDVCKRELGLPSEPNTSVSKRLADMGLTIGPIK